MLSFCSRFVAWLLCAASSQCGGVVLSYALVSAVKARGTDDKGVAVAAAMKREGCP